MVPMAALDEHPFRWSQTTATTKPYHCPAHAGVFALILPAAVPLKAIGWSNAAATWKFESVFIRVHSWLNRNG
jgi:hypothetical protein